jgi:hypothetical protein
MNSGTDVPAAARDLARYLREHPNASDMADGIRRWWFSESDAVTENELDEALNWMQQQGLIEAELAADGRLRYRRICSDQQLDLLLQPPARPGHP